jgi:hypothetical protein
MMLGFSRIWTWAEGKLGWILAICQPWKKACWWIRNNWTREEML